MAKKQLAVGLDAGVRPVFVSKQRCRFRVGDLRAESTDITIVETGEVLHTMSIEGDDLEQLRARCAIEVLRL